MASPAIVSRTRWRSVSSCSRALAAARLIGRACLVVCCIGIVDARAEIAVDPGPTAESEACARDHFNETGGGVAASDRRRSPVPIGDEVGAAVPVWKTITLGTHETPKALRAALKAADCAVGDLAGDLLRLPAFTVSSAETEISLAVLSAAELGFGAEGASRAAIYRRAAQLGLEFCPAEIGPQLRLQYDDQPLGEFLQIAMEPVVTAERELVNLSVGNGGAGLLLVGGDGRLDSIVPPSVRFVFVHPQDVPVTSAGARYSTSASIR